MAIKRKWNGAARRSKRAKGAIYRKAKRRNFVKAVKSIALRSMETKSYFYNVSGSLVHQVPKSYNLNYYIGQGTADNARIGDEIFIRGISVRLAVNDTTSNGTHRYHVYILKSKTDIYLTSHAYGDIYKNISLDPTTDVIDTEKVTVVSKRVVTIENRISGAALQRSVRMWVNLKNTKFKFQGDNSGYGKFFNYFLVVVPYANGGTIGTTGAGSVFGHAQVYFKDG